MAKRTIVAMPGDGIGKVVLDEAIRVLDAAGFEAEYVHGDIGWEFCSNTNSFGVVTAVTSTTCEYSNLPSRSICFKRYDILPDADLSVKEYDFGALVVPLPSTKPSLLQLLFDC